MSEAVFDGNDAKLTYRSYDDLFFDGDDVKLTYRGWKTTPKWVRPFLSGTNDSFLTETMRNSPTEATTTFFFDGDDVNLTYRGWKTTPKWVRPFLSGMVRTHLPRLRRNKNETKTSNKNDTQELVVDKFWLRKRLKLVRWWWVHSKQGKGIFRCLNFGKIVRYFLMISCCPKFSFKNSEFTEINKFIWFM